MFDCLRRLVFHEQLIENKHSWELVFRLMHLFMYLAVLIDREQAYICVSVHVKADMGCSSPWTRDTCLQHHAKDLEASQLDTVASQAAPAAQGWPSSSQGQSGMLLKLKSCQCCCMLPAPSDASMLSGLPA